MIDADVRIGLEQALRDLPDLAGLPPPHCSIRENCVEWTEHERAIQTEAFRFLESELRRGTLTALEPGGMEYWPDRTGPHIRR